MATLNQIIAIEKGVKSRVHGAVTELYKLVQKAELFNGLSRTYQKRDEEGEDLPAEKKRVQMTTAEALKDAQKHLAELMEVTARKDWTNCQATADVTIDGTVLIEQAPVTFLLFLEKQLVDLRTFIDSLPVLDEAETWTRDENAGLWRTEPTQTHRTKKVQKPVVLYPATTEHPAQTQMVTEDVVVGYWSQVKQSGALPKPARAQLAERVDAVLRAVKQAREAANAREEVAVGPVGERLFAYLFKA